MIYNAVKFIIYASGKEGHNIARWEFFVNNELFIGATCAFVHDECIGSSCYQHTCPHQMTSYSTDEVISPHQMTKNSHESGHLFPPDDQNAGATCSLGVDK